MIFQAQTTIWLEDFQGLVDRTIVENNPTAWLRDVTNCDFTDADKGYFEVRCDKILGRDTKGEEIWYSQWIDISRNWNKPFIYFDSRNMLIYIAYKLRSSTELSYNKKVVLFSLNPDTLLESGLNFL
jgi:hypothetical protein